MVATGPYGAVTVRRPAATLALGVLGVGVGYWLLAKVGSTAQYTGGVPVAWLPVGFAAAMLYLGDMRWAFGAVAADLILGTGLFPFHLHALLHDPTVSYQTAGNTFEFVLAAVLMRRWLRPHSRLERPADVMWLVLAFCVGEPVVSALGTLSVWRAGDIAAGEMPSFFRTWFLGDIAGALLVAPLLLVWVGAPLRWRVSRREAIQAIAAIGAVVVLSIAAFSSHNPLTYIVFPALTLVALRLGQRGATVALVLAFVIAVAMTASSVGPFVERSINNEALNTQLYILIATITTLTLGAAVSARRKTAIALTESRRREAERGAEERERIARDLHDSVSQTLFSLGLHAGTVKHELARTAGTDRAALSDAVQEISELAHAALLEMRASIFDLRGAAVTEQGVVAALAAHAAALSARHQVRVTVEGPDNHLPVAPEVQELLFRVGQEAITNAVKHSGSAEICAQVTSEPSQVSLVVRDRGAGFDPTRRYDGHIGLELMRARARDAGGTILVDSEAGAGTTVRLAVPAITGAQRPPGPRGPRAAPPASAS